MSNNQHKNGARNQLRTTSGDTVEAKWFANRRKRNRVRDRIAKLARRKNRGRA